MPPKKPSMSLAERQTQQQKLQDKKLSQQQLQQKKLLDNKDKKIKELKDKLKEAQAAPPEEPDPSMEVDAEVASPEQLKKKIAELQLEKEQCEAGLAKFGSDRWKVRLQAISTELEETRQLQKDAKDPCQVAVDNARKLKSMVEKIHRTKKAMAETFTAISKLEDKYLQQQQDLAEAEDKRKELQKLVFDREAAQAAQASPGPPHGAYVADLRKRMDEAASTEACRQQAAALVQPFNQALEVLQQCWALVEQAKASSQQQIPSAGAALEEEAAKAEAARAEAARAEAAKAEAAKAEAARAEAAKEEAAKAEAARAEAAKAEAAQAEAAKTEPAAGGTGTVEAARIRAAPPEDVNDWTTAQFLGQKPSKLQKS